MAAKEGDQFKRASLVTKFVSALQALDPRYIVWCQGMLFFEKGEMSYERFRAVVQERFLSIGRFRSRYDFNKHGFVALAPEEIDMDYHVEEISDEMSVDEIASIHLGDVYGSKKIDENKPLWYALFFPNLKDGRSLAVMCVSHTIGDGVSLVELIFKTMDPEEERDEVAKLESYVKDDVFQIRDDPKKQLKPAPKRKTQSYFGPVNKAGIFLGGVAGALLATAAKPDSENPLMRKDPKNPSLKKNFAFTSQIDLERLKEMKNSVEDATINDVLVALLNLIVDAYIKEKGLTPEEMRKKKIRAAFPMNLRSAGESALKEDSSPSNNFAFGMFQFFMDFKDRVDIIQKVKSRIDTIKVTPFPVLQLKIGSFLGKLMSAKRHAQLILEFSSQATAQLSNVAGPQKAVYFGGSKVVDLQFGLYSTVGLYLGLISYDGKVSCCVCMDDSIGEAKELAKFWDSEFEKMYEEVMERAKEGVIKRPNDWGTYLQQF